MCQFPALTHDLCQVLRLFAQIQKELMLLADLTGHFIDSVDIDQTNFVTNVEQVDKVMPAFDAITIFDQVVQYQRLLNELLKPQAAVFHGIDDVSEHPLKATAILDIATPEHINGQPESTDQVLGIALCRVPP